MSSQPHSGIVRSIASSSIVLVVIGLFVIVIVPAYLQHVAATARLSQEWASCHQSFDRYGVWGSLIAGVVCTMRFLGSAAQSAENVGTAFTDTLSRAWPWLLGAIVAFYLLRVVCRRAIGAARE